MSYLKSFLWGAIFGSVEGVAEECTGAKVKAKKSKNGKKRPKSNRNKANTKSNKRYNQFKQRKSRAGLRKGDPARAGDEVTQLFKSIPSEVRYGSDEQWEKFLNKKQFGHIESYKNGGSNDVTNFIWQDPHSNQRLGAKNMPPELKSLLKQANNYEIKFGKKSASLSDEINAHLDTMSHNKHKSQSTRKKNGRKRQKSKSTKSSSKSIKPSKIDIVAKNGGHIAANQMGRVVGKAAGKVVGKKVVKVLGKKAAKKLGKKVLKKVPVIGTVLSFACGAYTIWQDPDDVRNYVQAVSDVGTSFLGPAGLVVDVAVSSAVEYNRACD